MPKLRPLPAREVCSILQAHGFMKMRQAGSHIILRLDLPGGDSRTVPVPNHQEIAIGTLKSIIQQSGLDAVLFPPLIHTTLPMHILITAGPTREPLDPVRYLTNRSSGRMGYALAEAARNAGHEVTLVSGPVTLAKPEGMAVVKIETAKEMYEAVQKHISSADIAIFAAAVADYRPAVKAEQKIKKGAETLTLELERTEDILGSTRSVFGFKGILVGFAAETEKLIEHAQDKLVRKGCDLIIANDVSQPGIGFDSAENAVTLCLPGGRTEVLPQQSKAALASELMQFISSILNRKD